MTTKRLIAVLVLLGKGEHVSPRSLQAVIARSMACPRCKKPSTHAALWIHTHGKVSDLPVCACGWDENLRIQESRNRTVLEEQLRRVSRPRSPIEILIDRAVGKS